MPGQNLKKHLKTPLFELTVTMQAKEASLSVVHLKTKDRYHHRQYSVERKLFRGFTDLLQKYLKKNPHIHFNHRLNLARPLVYLSPGVRAWAAYMPGGFATHHVHSPEIKRLKNGKRVDFMTRRLFRHAVDAIGLRSRAHVLTWLVHQHAAGKQKPAVSWLSLASGSGQPLYDTVDSLPSIAFKVRLTDLDQESLDFAKKIYGIERPHVKSIDFKLLDVLQAGAAAAQIKEMKADLVDAMGLFEYLEEEQASQLIQEIYEALPQGGRFIFTNMSDSNPHLDLHKRGLGWPGVIPRSRTEVVRVIRETDVPIADVTAYAPTDKVYNIFAIMKA